MTEQRRIGFKWHLRHLMAQRNLWKSTELHALLKSRGINLSESQVYRLVTGTPERIPGNRPHCARPTPAALAEGLSGRGIDPPTVPTTSVAPVFGICCRRTHRHPGHRRLLPDESV
jgi:7-keto-8-aminopelargonate synthetase-like enzyme